MQTANGSAALDDLLARLEGVRSEGDGYQACCPAHDDNRASLSVNVGDDGRILLFCHANCATADVVRQLGMTMADLAPRSMGNGHSGNGRRVVAEYNYKLADGTLEFQVTKFEPKDFRQRRPDGHGGWTPSVKGCKIVPYRLPELLAADHAETVFIVEGEKDVDRLRSLGLIATCNAGGAGKWRSAHADCIPEGRNFVIVPDNDPTGRKHAEQVEQSLRRRAKSVRILNLPDLPDKGDVSDWLNNGGTVQQLRALAAASNNPFRKTTVEKFTFAQLREAYPELAEPVIDGIGRMGETVNINADPKIGKSWMLYGLLLSIITGRDWLGYYPTTKGKVLLIDNELTRSVLAYRIAEVAAAMGIEPQEYENDLEIWPLRGNLRSIEELAREFDDVPPEYYRAVGCDARYRFPTAGGENDNDGTTAFYNTVDRMAAQTNALWVLIHHATKGSQADKKITDVGAGAGAQSRAADAHLIVRQHEDEGVVVLEGVVRSFPPPKPLALRWQWPLWHLDEWADTTKLAGRLPANEQRQGERDKEGQNVIVKALLPGKATVNELIRRGIGMGKPRAEKLLGCLIAEGHVDTEQENIQGNNATVYWLKEGVV